MKKLFLPNYRGAVTERRFGDALLWGPKKTAMTNRIDRLGNPTHNPVYRVVSTNNKLRGSQIISILS